MDLESKYFNSHGKLHNLSEVNEFMALKKGIVNTSFKKSYNKELHYSLLFFNIVEVGVMCFKYISIGRGSPGANTQIKCNLRGI